MNSIDLLTLNSTIGFKILGATSGGEAGFSVSAGDINSDGINDIIIGVPSVSHSDRTNAGAVYVVYGKPGGLTDIDLLHLTTAQGFKILGAESNARTGHSISNAGDINGDGFSDLIVGTALNQKTYVIYGKPGGLADIDLKHFTAAQGFKISGSGSSGAVVSSASDINGDGFSDVIVGIDAYYVYVIYGKLGGLADIDLDHFTEAQGFKILVGSGAVVSGAGDINGDGFSDVIVSKDAVVYVIYGKLGGSTNIDLQKLTEAQGFKILERARYGNSVTIKSASSAGDINGDGRDDIIVGAIAISNSISYDSYENRAYVIYGKSGGFTDISLISLTSLQGFRILGAGNSVSNAGDTNGDGISDIIVSAFNDSPNDRTNAGAAYVVYGKTGGLADLDLASLTPEQGFKILGAVSYDNAGHSVSSVGDINGDGLDDVIIGAPGATPNSRGYAGMAYVIYGVKPIIVTTEDDIIHPTPEKSSIETPVTTVGVTATTVTPPSHIPMIASILTVSALLYKLCYKNRDAAPPPYQAPIGIALGSNQIELISLTQSQVYFDYLDNGMKVKTSWIGPKDAFLIYDHNSNREVDAAKELVLTRWSETATTDFMALKEVFDNNKDNKFDAKDAEFQNFLIWQDKNQDGTSQGNEIKSLSEAGLIRIDFDTEQTVVDEFFGKQQEMQVAGILWVDGRETLAYDLALECSSKHAL